MIITKWIKVRSVDGVVALNTDHISDIQKAGSGFAVRMASGTLYLLVEKEAQKVFRAALPKGLF